MEENFLPSDLGRSSKIYDNEEKKTIYPQLFNSTSSNSFLNSSPNSNPSPNSNSNPIFKPTNTFSKPIQEFNNEKIETKKKVNFFVKMSNFVARKPKISLVFIMCLILCILILIIYYRGILFLGPFCPNNIKSKKFNNESINKKTSNDLPDNKTTDILKSLR